MYEGPIQMGDTRRNIPSVSVGHLPTYKFKTFFSFITFLGVVEILFFQSFVANMNFSNSLRRPGRLPSFPLTRVQTPKIIYR